LGCVLGNSGIGGILKTCCPLTLVRISTNRLTMSSSTSPENHSDSPEAPAKTADAVAASHGATASNAGNAAVVSTSQRAAAAANTPREYDVLMKTVFSLFAIGMVVGLVFAWTGYANRYAQVTEGWHLGQTKLVEVTVVKEDKGRLACASDVISDDVHCGFRASGQPFEASTQDDSHVLSPYNTVKNELFLAAGLWTSPALSGPMPTERFTVACNYKVLGVLKSVGLRWQPNGSFDPVKQSVTVGSLTDCVIPK